MKEMEKYQRVYARVDLDALHANVEAIEKIISPGAKIMGIIKANGYGHGAAPIGRELETFDTVFGYGVATAGEALTLREAGLKKPILILGYTFSDCYEELIKHDISMAVFRYDTLEELSACAAKLGKKAKIHIKVDTGMSRIGVFPDESGLAFVKKALSYEALTIEGVFTHFARADEKDKRFAEKQFDRISQFWDKVETQTGYRIPIKHCANSAGIVELPKTHMDMVRAGIILYGLWPSDEVEKDKIALRPILSLKSHIVHIKEVEKGTSVSYGGTYVTDKNMRIATIPVGYADGYPRALSGKGYVLIHGKKAPILGRICMDQFMVSVDDIPQAQPLDEVTLIGKDGAEEITMEMLGNLSGRFNYEFACGLGERVPRIYIKKEKICAYTF
ncbi:MAG: alanine racemase [Bacillus sp. (in: Bacteria)]|nr:alanine racemase [Bacillus sp. (in: firmicutes)]